ncbi:PRC-barrel domain protein [Rhodobacteraceae bacterium THAF1]|uniref:PRC-barrel domain-containing protein n=1 Tax=Palleronia sp. THAF1 TaxID=2587842 RepID=UPI000F3FFE71|nr:PRC-barrel domain-containing protein [Palleronia sp. THAF1]QFU08079.1 PRC-barrel domain protein [Palleronia sp. THAF1]VDC27937.1 PRC-barrel domain protein [Rhodobacteraceae bacterium THAF1]
MFYRYQSLTLATVLAAAPAFAQEQDAPASETISPLAEILGVDPGPEEFEDIAIDGLSVESLRGAPVVSTTEESLGAVQDVLIDEDAEDKLVIDRGGIFEMGSRDVVLPLSQAQVMETAAGSLRVVTAADFDALPTED